MLKVIADTNILVSATIAKGNEFKLLELARSKKIKLFLSPQILKEFEEVISRPKFGFSQEQIIHSSKQIITICTIVIPLTKLNIVKEDPSDNKILECAVNAKADYIVSGDSHLLNLKKYENIKIVTTRFILEKLIQ